MSAHPLTVAISYGLDDIDARAAADVINERKRQIEAEGWTAEHDVEHDAGDLAAAASCYALSAADSLNPYSQGDGIPEDGKTYDWWPFDAGWWKPDRENPRRDLVRSAALALAEIARYDREHKAD